MISCLSIYDEEILCRISKVFFEIPHKIFCLFIEQILKCRGQTFLALEFKRLLLVFKKYHLLYGGHFLSASVCQWPLYQQVCNWLHFNGLVQERHNSIANALELRLSCANPNGLVQERRNSIANALELRLSCANPSIYGCISIYTKDKTVQWWPCASLGYNCLIFCCDSYQGWSAKL